MPKRGGHSSAGRGDKAGDWDWRLPAADRRAAARVCEDDRLAVAVAAALDDDAARRHVGDIGAAETPVASLVNGHPRRAAAAATTVPVTVTTAVPIALVAIAAVVVAILHVDAVAGPRPNSIESAEAVEAAPSRPVNPMTAAAAALKSGSS